MRYKDLLIDGQQTHYIILEDGYIFNLVTHRGSNGSVSNGYWRYQITMEDGKIKTIMKHRALAEAFIPNDDPVNKTVIHHIDGNPYNNDLSNLQWMSQKENSQHQINPKQTIPFSKPLTEEEKEQEIWVEFIPQKYAVSNLGRVKNLTTNYITTGSINKNSGYVRWNLIDKNGKHIEFQAHRAVYQAFHPDEVLDVINHIDGVRNNNRLSNLENISQSENVSKMHYGNGKFCVAQLNDNNEIIKIYSSASEAERQLAPSETHKSVGQISGAIRRHGKAFGYYWERLETNQI